MYWLSFWQPCRTPENNSHALGEANEFPHTMTTYNDLKVLAYAYWIQQEGYRKVPR